MGFSARVRGLRPRICHALGKGRDRDMAVKVDTSDMKRALRKLGEQSKVAMMRSLNRGASAAKTSLTRSVAADIGTTQKAVRDGITVRNATVSQQSAQVIVTGSPIPLIDLRAKG